MHLSLDKPHTNGEAVDVDKLKQRIIFNLLVTPTTVGPFTAGATILLVSWALGANAVWPFIGLLSIFAGFGMAATNYFYNFDKASERAIESLREQAKELKEDELDELDECLVAARGPRPDLDQTYLRELREMYSQFVGDIESGSLKTVTRDIREQVKLLFDACIEALEHSYDLWESASKIKKSETKNSILREREKVIDEVGKSVERFQTTIDEVRTLNLKATEDSLSKIRTELSESLEIARKTNEAMSAFTLDDANGVRD